MTPAEKITAAKAATERAEECVQSAMDAIERAFLGPAITNVHDVYVDPKAQTNAIREASRRLLEAAATISGTSWPTAADYEALSHTAGDEARENGGAA